MRCSECGYVVAEAQLGGYVCERCEKLFEATKEQEADCILVEDMSECMLVQSTADDAELYDARSDDEL